MRVLRCAGVLAALLAPACGSGDPPDVAAAGPAADRLQAVLAAENRSAENRARDAYRHPAETLAFFSIDPGMTVVEISPGGGWYTEILAPLLREEGRLYTAGYDPKSDSEYVQRSFTRFGDKLAGDPEAYDRVVVTVLAPGRAEIAPAGSADAVLTFRNVHSWMGRGGGAKPVFDEMFAALKPGGTLGVVEHRADPSAEQDPKAESGYVRQDHVIALAESAGFEFVASTEINANPKDTRDHEKGVWTLPPSFRLGDVDREKYAAIGESDRMTLKFRKP